MAWISAWRIRSEASTDPPGLSTRTTSAFRFLARIPFSIARAMESPPAVPSGAFPSTIVPAMVTTPIGPLGFWSTTSATYDASLMRL